MPRKLFLFLITISVTLTFGTNYVLCEDDIETQPKKQIIESICPVTKVKGKLSDCLLCHVAGSFQVKETNPDDLRSYPCPDMFVRDSRAYLVIKDIDSRLADNVLLFFDYLNRHKIDHAIFELHTPGGSLFDACRIIGIMTAWEQAKEGRIVETRVNGFAASAGFLIATSGTMGYRFVSKISQMMFHELWTFSMFKITSPSSSEDEAKILRYIQDTINDWIVSRSKLTKEKLNEKISKKEFWVNGQEAVQYGFMDSLLN